MKTQRNVAKLREKAAKVNVTVYSRKWLDELQRKAALLCKQSLEEWPSLLEKICGDERILLENLHSIFTFGLLYSLHLEVSLLLETFLIQKLSLHKAYSRRGDPPGRQKVSSSLRLPLHKASNGILTHITDMHSIPGFHVCFAKKEQTAQLSSLLTEEGLRGMMEKRRYYAVDVLFLFEASFDDRCLGFVERCDLTWTSVRYALKVNKKLSDS